MNDETPTTDPAFEELLGYLRRTRGFDFLHTGTTELPQGDSNASIIAPRAGRVEWPSIGSLIAYAVPPAPGAALPAVIELPRANLMKYPGRSSGILGPRYDRWGVDLAPPCHSPVPVF